MSDFFGDGLKGVIEFALTEVVVLQEPESTKPVSVCELICGGARMGFYHVPEDPRQMRPVVPGMFSHFLPVKYFWQATITDDLLPYIEQAMRPPGGLILPDAIQYVVGIFGTLKLFEPHRLNSQLLGLAHPLDDSIRNEVEKHALIAPTIYQLPDFEDQYRVVATVARALLG